LWYVVPLDAASAFSADERLSKASRIENMASMVSFLVARWQLGNLQIEFPEELIFLHVRRKVNETTRHFEGAKEARHSEGSVTDSSILLYL